MNGNRRESVCVCVCKEEGICAYLKTLCNPFQFKYPGFIIHDPGYQVHNREIREATDYLLNTLCPKVARRVMESVLEAEGQVCVSVCFGVCAGLCFCDVSVCLIFFLRLSSKLNSLDRTNSNTSKSLS